MHPLFEEEKIFIRDDYLTLAAALLLTTYAHADTFGAGDNQFAMEFVTIGDPGNPADMTGNPNPAGSVDYVYRIGKYEVSREMVEKASDAGGLGLTLDPMDRYNGGSRPDMPATGVSWNEAARFVNWLNTSEGFSPAYKFATQPGDGGYNVSLVPRENILLWEPADPGYDAANPFRNSQAHYFLPSVHEWYKAAFYDPDANGGAGGYWDFATGRDRWPPTAVTSGTGAHTAVWSQRDTQGPADITQAGGLSPYGVMGQAGNVWEWEETELDLMNDNGSSIRGARGGSWDWVDDLSASDRGLILNPTRGSYDVGFRVASVPEPSTLLLGVLGMLGLMQRRRRSS